jgi:hypothetical protein
MSTVLGIRTLCFLPKAFKDECLVCQHSSYLPGGQISKILLCMLPWSQPAHRELLQGQCMEAQVTTLPTAASNDMKQLTCTDHFVNLWLKVEGCTRFWNYIRVCGCVSLLLMPCSFDRKCKTNKYWKLLRVGHEWTRLWTGKWLSSEVNCCSVLCVY